ncbi:MAG: ATPase [Thermoplasmata archaeon]|nr:MAG: ATPase [Thermoplasmata archaeon]
MNKEEILEILIDWNYWGSYKDESIERPAYLKKLDSFLKTGEITVVKGTRRTGKSTIILQFINRLIKKGLASKNTLIVNFEDPRFRSLNLELLNKIYEIYLEELLPEENHYVVLDEVHQIKGWEKFARFLKEAKRVNVLITGSSSKLLSEEYSTLLSGRHIDLNVFPLSFKEFLEFKKINLKTDLDKIKHRHKIKNMLKEYIEYGSFPKVVLTQEAEKKVILEGYFRDILLKDVQKRFKIKEVEKLETLAKYYLANISTIQPFNKVKKVVNLSLDSVERFSNYFSIAGIFFFIPKFSYSHKEQVLNPKKVYAIDTGLRNAVSFRFSQDLGRLIENIVLIELKRRNFEVYYWKSQREKEVDFVIKKDEQIKQLLQVCVHLSDEKNKKREIQALIECSEYTKCKDLLIITQDYEDKEKYKDKVIKYIPLWKWLLESV